MGDIVDNNVEGRAGSGSITISHPNLPDDNIKTSSLGETSIEFDIEGRADDANSIYFLPSKFEFSVFDKMGSGNSFFKALDNNLLSTDTIEVTFSFTTDGGWSWTDDTIEFTVNDIEYKNRKREVKVEGVYNKSFISGLDSIFVALDTYDLNTGGSTKTVVTCKDYIEKVLDLVSSSGATIINNSSNFQSDPFDGSETWVLMKDHDGTTAEFEQEKDPLKIMYRLAAADGAVLSFMMGEAFWTSRLETSLSSTVEQSDVSDIQINPGLQNYRSISAQFWSRLGTSATSEWGSNYIMFDNLNPDAKKDLLVKFYMLEMQPAKWNSTNTEFDDDGFAFINPTGAQLKSEAEEGTFRLFLEKDSSDSNPTNDPNLAENDIFFINVTGGPYLTLNSGAGYLTSKIPMKKEYESGGKGKIEEEVNATKRQELAKNATECYAKSYGADGSRKIEVSFYDIDTLKPYETFKLGTSFDDNLQGQHFRPSKLTYDLQRDIVKTEAYQIA